MFNLRFIYEPGSRVRDVEVDSNGDIYVALENPGRIVRLTKIIKWKTRLITAFMGPIY